MSDVKRMIEELRDNLPAGGTSVLDQVADILDALESCQSAPDPLLEEAAILIKDFNESEKWHTREEHPDCVYWLKKYKEARGE